MPRAERVQLPWLLMGTGRIWSEAGANPDQRAAVLAAFSLEAAAELAEQGQWPARRPGECAGVCLVEWACALLGDRGVAAAPFERAWMRASLSVMSGVREWTAIYAPAAASTPFDEGHGHAQHALDWFAADPDFRLARAQAIAARFEPTTEQDAPAENVRLEPKPVTALTVVTKAGTPARETAAVRRARLRANTLDELRALTSLDAVRGAAGARLAYAEWAAGDYELAERQALDTASHVGSDNDARYLALFLAGMAAQSSGALPRAEAHFAAALKARPHSQSASLALAALQFGRGDANAAYDLTLASLTERRNDDDPWRMFFYGNFSQWPALRDAMRAALPTGGAQ